MAAAPGDCKSFPCLLRSRTNSHFSAYTAVLSIFLRIYHRFEGFLGTERERPCFLTSFLVLSAEHEDQGLEFNQRWRKWHLHSIHISSNFHVQLEQSEAKSWCKMGYHCVPRDHSGRQPQSPKGEQVIWLISDQPETTFKFYRERKQGSLRKGSFYWRNL